MRLIKLIKLSTPAMLSRLDTLCRLRVNAGSNAGCSADLSLNGLTASLAKASLSSKVPGAGDRMHGAVTIVV